MVCNRGHVLRRAVSVSACRCRQHTCRLHAAVAVSGFTRAGALCVHMWRQRGASTAAAADACEAMFTPVCEGHMTCKCVVIATCVVKWRQLVRACEAHRSDRACTVCMVYSSIRH